MLYFERQLSALGHSKLSYRLCCRPATYLFLNAFCKDTRNQKPLKFRGITLFFFFLILLVCSYSTFILVEVHRKILSPIPTNLQRFLLVFYKIIRIFTSGLNVCYIIRLNKIKHFFLSSPLCLLFTLCHSFIYFEKATFKILRKSIHVLHIET